PSCVETKSAAYTLYAFGSFSFSLGDRLSASCGYSGSYALPTSSLPLARAITCASGTTASLRASASHSAPAALSTFTYSISAPTASATFPGSVHGVVGHAKKYSSASVSLNFTYTDGSFTSA